MTLADLPPLYVSDAIPDRVKFGRGTGHEVSVSMQQTAAALTDVVGVERTVLGGYPVDEQDITSLMNAMRAAAGLTRCDRCNQWTDAGDLCEPCAQEAYDVRMEQLRDRQQEWTR